MPLAFTVDNLSVPQVNLIQGLQTTELKDVSGSVSTDKVQHRINLTHLRQGDAEYSGQLAINGKKPFVLDGQIDAVLHDERNDYCEPHGNRSGKGRQPNSPRGPGKRPASAVDSGANGP